MKRNRDYDAPPPRRGPPTKRFKPSTYPNRTIPLRGSPTEKKVQDVAITLTEAGANPLTNAGYFSSLCVPITGASMTERVGRKTQIKSCYLRGMMMKSLAATPTGSVTAEAQMVRLILIFDKQPNAAVPVMSDILQTSTVYSQFNINNRDRFSILKDKEYVFDPMIYDSANNAYAWNRTIHPVKIFKKLDLEQVFNAGSAGTAADINTGNLLLFLLTNTAPGADKNINVYLTSRVRYTDV